MSKIDEKICGETDCVRYDVESPLCDFCELNMKWKRQHSAPVTTDSVTDCRDVG